MPFFPSSSSSLPFQLTEAVVLTVGFGGSGVANAFNEHTVKRVFHGSRGAGREREVNRSVGGGLSTSFSFSSASNSCCSREYTQLLQCLKRDVLSSIQHLSVSPSDVWVHLGSVRELCGGGGDGGGEAKKEVAAYEDAYGGRGYDSCVTRLKASALATSTSLSSQNPRRIPGDTAGTATTRARLGPSFVNIDRLKAATSSTIQFKNAYEDAFDARSENSYAALRSHRHDSIISQTNEMILIVAIYVGLSADPTSSIGIRPDVPVILSSLKTAINASFSLHHEKLSSSATLSQYFRHTSNFLKAITTPSSSSSHISLLPILHNCVFGGNLFAGVKSSSLLSNFRFSASQAAEASSANTILGLGARGSSSCSSSSFSSADRRQLSIDRALLESLPFYCDGGDYEEGGVVVKVETEEGLTNGSGRRGSAVRESATERLSISSNRNANSSQYQTAATTTIEYTMKDIRAFLHESRVKALEREIIEERTQMEEQRAREEEIRQLERLRDAQRQRRKEEEERQQMGARRVQHDGTTAHQQQQQQQGAVPPPRLVRSRSSSRVIEAPLIKL